MRISYVKTNIVNIFADAIVLPANSMLKEGSGASHDIYEAAGRKQLKNACAKIGNCEMGSAVPTLAFNLNAKYIIHAVVPKWINGLNGEYDLLSSAYLSALQIADVMGCTSIAFPLLASGNNGYNQKLAFQIAKESIESFEGLNLKSVVLVLFNDHIVAYAKEQGQVVNEIPFNLHEQAIKQEHRDKVKKMVNDGKEIAQNFLEDQIQKGLDFLKDEKNREKILAAGIMLAKEAYKIMKKAN